MADSSFELNQFCYHMQSNGDRARAQQVDELAIANMLAVVNNPVLCEMLSADDLRSILEVIKNHAVMKAKLFGDIQQQKISTLNRNKGLY